MNWFTNHLNQLLSEGQEGILWSLEMFYNITEHTCKILKFSAVFNLCEHYFISQLEKEESKFLDTTYQKTPSQEGFAWTALLLCPVGQEQQLQKSVDLNLQAY